MYSQYSYYQNNTSGAPQQQQQQQQTSTSGQVWNGQQWVQQQQQPTTATAMAPTATASYATITSSQPSSSSSSSTQIIKHNKTHTGLVQHYTQYYHHWNTQASQSKTALSSLPPPHPNTPSNNAQREEMERREKWATYYASNSAALAHYHLNLSKVGAGGEPYARPSSPPAPPQMQQAGATAVAAGVVGGASTVGAAASTVASGLSAISTTATTTAATSPNRKKKSRWASSAGDGNYEDGTQIHGKSLAAAATTTGSRSGAVAEKNSNNDHLYLDKFVQEKKDANKGSNSTGTGSSNTTSYYDNTFSDTHNKSKTSTLAASSGTKRKMMDPYNDSSLLSTNNGSYYGPAGRTSSFGAGNGSNMSSFNSQDDDYVPLGLDKPLGGGGEGGISLSSSPGSLSKKEKKKQKKLAAKQAASAALGGSSGFDSNHSALSERAQRFKGKGGIHDVSNVKSSIDNFDKYMGKTTIGGSKKQLNDHDYERMTVKGTCTTLDKEYLRLTSPPRSELVRPQRILEQHLSNLKQSYYAEGKNIHNGKVREYDWYCSQFKAIRQDLTVQRIVNAFAVDVYETHAKVALEEDDINEYNQSQTQLKELYDLLSRKESLKKKENRGALKNREEFIAYRIIYYVFLSGNRKYEGGSSDIFKIMLQLTPEQRKDEFIHHALLVRAAVADNDYHKFFQLQDCAPNMGDYLMDKIVPSVRQGALQRICKAYRPSVSTDFVLKELGFDIRNKQEVLGGKAWMESCGCKFEKENLVAKDTILKEIASGVKNSLI